MDLLLFPLIGLLAGWIAGHVTKGSGFGLIGNLFVGVLGAVLGGILFWILGLEANTLRGKLFSAIFGAVALLSLLKAYRKRTSPP